MSLACGNSLTHLFQREGHAVRVAGNGNEAMELLRGTPLDLFISDVRMPDMDGIELLRSARELFPHIEVVLMTAFANVDTAREAFLLGAYDFVQKPFDNEVLKETVRALYRKFHWSEKKKRCLKKTKF